jgi:tetratricopeptide (TPR) repeat protein
VRWACDLDNAGALAEYGLQVRDAPGDALARVNLGYTHMAMGQWQDGLEHLRAAFALDPRSYFVAMLVIERMVAVRQFEEASAACARAAELSPGDARAASLCAMIPFWRDGDTGAAAAALDGLQTEWTASGSAVANAVDLLTVLPERTLALHAAGKLPDPVSPSAPYIPRAVLLGAAYRALGRPAEARAAFAEAVPALERHAAAARAAGDPSSLAVQLFWLARAHAGAGRGEEALREAAEAQALVGDVSQRAIDGVDLAEIAAMAGRSDEAVRHLREVLASPYALYTAAALRALPPLASLRGDPEFQALVGKAAPLAEGKR